MKLIMARRPDAGGKAVSGGEDEALKLMKRMRRADIRRESHPSGPLKERTARTVVDRTKRPETRAAQPFSSGEVERVALNEIERMKKPKLTSARCAFCGGWRAIASGVCAY